VILTVQRDTFTANSTTGELSIDGAFVCYTLEPRSDRSEGKPYCIPAGTYPATLVYSDKNGFITPRLTDVPGFTDIEIHPGNFPSDTEGCTLVGESRGIDVVSSSRAAFADLMARLDGQQEFNVTYIGGPNA
jgi:hypothetical protein